MKLPPLPLFRENGGKVARRMPCTVRAGFKPHTSCRLLFCMYSHFATCVPDGVLFPLWRHEQYQVSSQLSSKRLLSLIDHAVMARRCESWRPNHIILSVAIFHLSVFPVYLFSLLCLETDAAERRERERERLMSVDIDAAGCCGVKERCF